MNALIKELAEQAGIVFWEISGDVDWRQANRENLEKFAQLIVKECADLCDRFQARDVGMQPAECAAAIRKMFGVEE